jgi:hypothetical protein
MSAAARMMRTIEDEPDDVVTVDAVPGITGAAAYVGAVVSPAPVSPCPVLPERRSRSAAVVGSDDDASAGEGAGVAVPVVDVPLAIVASGVDVVTFTVPVVEAAVVVVLGALTDVAGVVTFATEGLGAT